MSASEASKGEKVLYQTEDGRTRLQCRFEDQSLCLTQVQLAELFQTSVPNINLHLKAIFAEAELAGQATIKSCSMVRAEGRRHVTPPVVFRPDIPCRSLPFAA
jgi:hypothetical protein